MQKVVKNLRISRILQRPDHSFFLLAPRGVGKSTWLEENFKDALYIDLLDPELQLRFASKPGRLENMTEHLSPGSWVIIDEVQKVPALLDVVHRLIHKRQLKFGLCGSSARKLRRSGANLLGGRAIALNMYPLTLRELGEGFSLNDRLRFGSLPLVVTAPELAEKTLKNYVGVYLKEEIKEESLVRQIESFSRFLEVAGLYHAQVLNLENLAREAQIPRTTAERYFEILVETLIASTLSPYRPNLRVKEASHKKFYWFDPGVARAATGVIEFEPESAEKGVLLESVILNELKAYGAYFSREKPIYYYRTKTGLEVDFVIQVKPKTVQSKAQVVCIEVKSSERWKNEWNESIRIFQDQNKLELLGAYGVYLGKEILNFNGITILPVSEFLRRLYAKQIY